MLKILFYITLQDGDGFYRMYEPSRMIKKLGLAKVVTNPFSYNGNTKDCWMNLEAGPDGVPKAAHQLAKVLGEPGKKPKVDAMVFQRHDSGAMFSLAMAIKEHYKIPVIQETDDYVWDVPGSNPGALAYYEKKPENLGNPDEPMRIARISLGNYDGYITSTPFLQKFYKSYAPSFVCPNSVDFSVRKPKKRKGHKGIRIMFSSSAGHYDSLKLINKAVQKIMDKHEDVTFYYFRGLPPLDMKYKKRCRKMKWVKPTHYWEYINSLEPDICLAPLTDRLFNRAKSNLRLLEYWSSKNAVIASPVEPYKNTIIDGKNGLLARPDEWEEKIEYLIKNPDKGKKMGEEGYKLAKKDFNLETNAKLWVNSIKTICDSYDPSREPPREYLPPNYRA